MMVKRKTKTRPPLKLEWREDALRWVNDNRRELPKGVTRPAAHAVVGMLMQAAQMDGRDVMASARWLERETGVNHAAAARFIHCLTKAGWLEYVGEGLRGAPVYDLIPASRRITPRSEDESEAERPRSDTPQSDLPSAEASAEGTADAPRRITPPLPTTDSRTPFPPKRGKGFQCSNCERIDGHDSDCVYRPFAGDAMALLSAELDAEEARCGICDQPSGDLVFFAADRANPIHYECGPAEWRRGEAGWCCCCLGVGHHAAACPGAGQMLWGRGDGMTSHYDECLRCQWQDTERKLGAAVYESITVGIGEGKPAESLHRWLDLYARRMAVVIEEAGVLALALEDDREPTP